MTGKNPKGAGRKKGVPNKITTDLKEMILGALNAAGGKGGGEEYLKRQALAHPGPFMALVGKVLPMQVTGKDGGAIEFTEIIRKIVK
jgi:hypothetical protein